MQTTENLGLKKPDKNEFYDVYTVNYNTDALDALFEKDANGDAVAKNAKTLDGHGAEYFAPLSRVIPQNVPNGTDLNTCIKTGVYFLNGVATNFTNVPNSEAHNGIIIVNTFNEEGANAERIVQLYFSPNQNKAYFRTSLGSVTSWKPWQEVFTTGGGTVNGDVTVSTDKDGNRIFTLSNGTKNIRFAVYAGGAFRIKDMTNDKEIILNNADGTNTFNGTASGNLPLSGGVIKSTGSGLLGIQSTNTDYAKIIFAGSSGNLGCIGINTANNPVFEKSGDSTKYTLLHTGNMADHVLPLSGGTVGDGTNNFPLGVIGSDKAGLKYHKANGGLLGYLGLNANGEPIKIAPNGTTTHTLLHTGNYTDYVAPKSHNQSASTISTGTLAGKVVANATATATLGEGQVRNITAGTDDMTAGTTSLTTGAIYVMYE